MLQQTGRKCYQHDGNNVFFSQRDYLPVSICRLYCLFVSKHRIENKIGFSVSTTTHNAKISVVSRCFIFKCSKLYVENRIKYSFYYTVNINQCFTHWKPKSFTVSQIVNVTQTDSQLIWPLKFMPRSNIQNIFCILIDLCILIISEIWIIME